MTVLAVSLRPSPTDVIADVSVISVHSYNPKMSLDYVSTVYRLSRQGVHDIFIHISRCDAHNNCIMIGSIAEIYTMKMPKNSSQIYKIYLIAKRKWPNAMQNTFLFR